MEVYVSLVQQAKVLVHGYLSSTRWFRNSGPFHFEAVPIPTASFSSASTQWKEKKSMK